MEDKMLNKFYSFIDGDRLCLTPLRHSDIELLRNWRNQENIRKFYIYQELITVEQQALWWDKYENNKNDYMFIISLNEEKINIGAIALYNICGQEAEFGRLMIPDEQYRGCGLASEACRLILQFGFESLGLQRIYLRVLPENTKAKSIYNSLGFSFIYTDGNIEFHELTIKAWKVINVVSKR